MKYVKYVGAIRLDGKVDITDPCYEKGTCCRITTDCKPGVYKGYIEIIDRGGHGNIVSSISIFNGDKIWGIEEMEHIGTIGVDTGMAGFFNDKPDFDDDAWNRFCDRIHDDDAWNFYNGVFSYSGYGDGSYDVYANKERSAFTIVFIENEY